MTRSFLLLGSIVLRTALTAQVTVNKPVILSTDGAASVTGIAAPESPAAPLPAGEQQAEAYLTTAPAGPSTWSIDLAALTGPPQPGLELRVVVPQLVEAPVLLSVNGGPGIPVQTAPGTELDETQLASGGVLQLLYDGSVFQVLGGDVHRTLPCPAGMVTVNDQYCIEPTNRSSATLEGASNICAALTRRLCTWAEFHTACSRRIELGVSTTSNDWEWTSNTANEDLNARVVRLAGCGDAGTRNSQTVPAPYRCCYTR